jgi:putative transposase
MRKYQVRFWRAAALVRESPTLILAAALVMLLWAQGTLPGFGTNLVDADVTSSTAKTPKRAGSMRQLGQMKRQKHALTGGDVETHPSTK